MGRNKIYKTDLERKKANYNSVNKAYKKYTFAFHRVSEEDVINKLDSERNKRQYILNLIRKDTKK